MNDFYASEEWRAFDLGHPGGAESTKKLLSKGNVTCDDRILDLCCGAGESVRVCAELGFDVCGADRASVIEYTRKNDPDHRYRVWETSEEMGANLPYEDGSLDVVLCECSLSLLKDKASVVNEIHRVLSRGGRFLISDVYDGFHPTLRIPTRMVGRCDGHAAYVHRLLDMGDGDGISVSIVSRRNKVFSRRVRNGLAVSYRKRLMCAVISLYE